MSDTNSIYITKYEPGTGSSDAKLHLYYVNNSGEVYGLVMTGYQEYTPNDNGVITISVPGSNVDLDALYNAKVYNTVNDLSGTIVRFSPSVDGSSVGSDISLSASVGQNVSAFAAVGVKNSSTSFYYFVKFLTLCFHEDTYIKMHDGTEKQICDLKRGDLILTKDGVAKPLARLIVTKYINKKFTCFEKDSLSEGIPNRKFNITPYHTILYKGSQYIYSGEFAKSDLFPGVGYKMSETGLYYHLQFETHEVVIANGMEVTSLPYNTNHAQLYLPKNLYFDESKYNEADIGKHYPPYMLHPDPLIEKPDFSDMEEKKNDTTN